MRMIAAQASTHSFAVLSGLVGLWVLWSSAKNWAQPSQVMMFDAATKTIIKTQLESGLICRWIFHDGDERIWMWLVWRTFEDRGDRCQD